MIFIVKWLDSNNFASKWSIFREQIEHHEMLFNYRNMYISYFHCNGFDDNVIFWVEFFVAIEILSSYCLWVLCIDSISAQRWCRINVERWCFILILPNGDLEYRRKF